MDRKFVFVIYGLAAMIGLGMSAWSWQIKRDASQERAEATMAREAAAQERVDMAERRAHLESPGGRDALVRGRGYVARDEKLIDQ
ncbi:MAG: hypothetical protein KF812_03130 [Fimbriimonadaceae bacterium]|nr:hypothetical protein [Fimbriimonadaceae bacterium]